MNTKPQIVPTDLIGPNEAAELLAVAASTVRRWVQTQKIPGFKVGGSVRISRADVVAMLKRVEPPGGGPLVETAAEAKARAEEIDLTLRAAGIRK